jgi:hypothetical protein
MFKFLKKVFGKKEGIVLSYEDFEKLVCGLNSISSKLEVLYNNKLSNDLEALNNIKRSDEDIEKLIKIRWNEIYEIKTYDTMNAGDIGKEGEVEKCNHYHKKVVVLDDIDYSPNPYHLNASKKIKRIYSEEKREDIYWVHINHFVDLSKEHVDLHQCLGRSYGLLPDFTIKVNDAVKQFRIIQSVPRSCDEINCTIDNIKKIYDKLAIGNEMLRECLEWNKSNNCKLEITLIRRGGAFAAEMGN